MNAVLALEWTARALGLLAVVQGIEFLLLRKSLRVWPWSLLEKELGRPLRLFLCEENFLLLNAARIALGLGALILPMPGFVVALFALHVLTLLRWLGTFNGGSDYMNLLLLWTTSLGLCFPDGDMPNVCLYYIAFQLCFSYFKAGWYKLKNPGWRSGGTLRAFLRSPIYAVDRFVDVVTRSIPLTRISAWVVILFEVTFPLSLLHPKVAIAYIVTGVLFHLGNAYFFGLNRFTFAWAAAYPALYYCSTY